MSPPKDPVKREIWLTNIRKRSQNPEWIRNHKEGIHKSSQTPEWIQHHKEAMVKNGKNPERTRKIVEKAKVRSQNPEWMRESKERNQKLSLDPEWLRKTKEGSQRRSLNPDYLRENKERNQKLSKDPEWIRKTTEGVQKRALNIEWRSNLKVGAQKRSNSPIWRLNHMEGLVGGFWYGNVRYPRDGDYCGLWCKDLWDRIDAAQNYQSILSGKTRYDNDDHALDRHHVYWQKKACCEWDEDVQGYFCWVDVRTKKNPNKVKYYIRGDPNKFVLLTKEEHLMVRKDKLKWIKIFEELIESKLDGICYLPKEE